MRQLDGRALAAEITQELKATSADLAAAGVVPTLAIVLFGEDAAAGSYVRSITRTAETIDVRCVPRRVPGETTAEQFLAVIDELDADPAVHGVVVQSPFPPGLGGVTLDGHLSPAKDVDGATAASLGRLVEERDGHVPATAAAVVEILDRAGVEIRGAHAVVVGRSTVVGKPTALLLLARDATVTICHLETVDLAAVTRQADILVVAIGDPRFIRPEHVRPGAAVIDVGINFHEGRLVGDVDYEAVAAVAGALTPVPGGVGPLTAAMLLRNVLTAAASA
ncbi:MAG: bifunctional 5,10-methylene-tetrahydrofolate dehydrogenase/5,10-methylene-tetrahydrofolate cyclohydrolase [Nitriliruptorales bacterium]|nr:bifunctional 5,10-methylene-tetrahydrofolate dehydrogenase/5,10-methylene-tetrahydrofolate cyclohydrolase [Nitriliruptorales bacterium]